MGCFSSSLNYDKWPVLNKSQSNKSCLLIVDIQNDLVEPFGILGVNGSSDIIPKIN